MDQHELLEQLRAVFRDELADHLATLEREVVTLARPDARAEDVEGALLEIHRAAHSLKGAARAVGYGEVERLCHELESRLAGVRQGARVDPAEARGATDQAIGALIRWAEQHGRGAPSAPADAGPAPEPAPSVPPPDHEAPESPTPHAGARPPEGFETVRVPVRSIAGIAVIGEELLGTANRGERLGTELGPLERALVELRRAVAAASRERRHPALEQAQHALRSLAIWTLDHRREQTLLWSEVRRKAAQLSGASRALRAVRVDALRPVIERAALETAADLGKRVTVALHGGDAQLDRRVVEGLRDPLVQLLRNAVDHGIEAPDERRAAGKPEVGRIEVSVRAVGTDVLLTIEDDGRGFDLEDLRRVAAALGVDADDEGRDLLELLFEPGFTTRGEATATSGRGIGLDVVRHRVAQMQGRVSVEPRPEGGARFRVVVPGDLSVTRGLVVEVAGQPFVLIETAVARCRLVREHDERPVEGRRYVLEGDELIPLAELATVLGVRGGERERRRSRPVVVLGAGDRRVAFAVDRFGGSQDVVVKPLGSRVRRAGVVIGATVLGEGDLACVLDAAALVHYGRAEARGDLEREVQRSQHTVLVVDDSVTTRQLLASILSSAGYRVETAPDGDQGWRRIAFGDPPDLIVSDIEMPHVDGFQLLARVRSSPKTARVPMVLVTALASDDDRRRALELGADAYVVKGRFDQQALLDTVEELLP